MMREFESESANSNGRRIGYNYQTQNGDVRRNNGRPKVIYFIISNKINPFQQFNTWRLPDR
jgi:hypothetical protein